MSDSSVSHHLSGSVRLCPDTSVSRHLSDLVRVCPDMDEMSGLGGDAEFSAAEHFPAAVFVYRCTMYTVVCLRRPSLFQLRVPLASPVNPHPPSTIPRLRPITRTSGPFPSPDFLGPTSLSTGHSHNTDVPFSHDTSYPIPDSPSLSHLTRRSTYPLHQTTEP